MGKDSGDFSLAIPPELLELHLEFKAMLPKKLASITELFQALSHGRWEHGEGETLHRMVHSLHGTAGTFGLKDVSLAAGQLERQLGTILRETTPPQDDAWAVLASGIDQINALGRQLKSIDTMPPSPATVHGDTAKQGPLIHLVSDAPAEAERLQTALALDGFRVEVFRHPEEFRIAAAKPRSECPAAVVLNMRDDGNEQSTAGLIQQLGLAEHPGIPLLVGLSHCDLYSRIAIARAGAKRTLPQPLVPEQLIEVLNNLTGRVAEEPWRVLLVDDEPMVLQAHAAYLRRAGMEVRTLTDPMQTLEEVQRFAPDVLVLDVYMPEVNGPEIASALRESNVNPHLAILFLSAETDMTQQLVALNLGGDDFLIKPVQPSHLVAAVTARARRARQNQFVQSRLETTLYERQREHLALDEHAIVSMANADGTISYANDLFCSTSGYNREEVIGQNHRLIKSGEHPLSFYQDMWSTITQGHVWQGEICNRHKDGSQFWVECTITPFLDAEGLPYQYVSIRTDISHIKAVEAATRKQRDMQRMISLAATKLMAAPTGLSKEAVNAALQASGEHLGADHAFLFRFSSDGEHMKNTHFWHAPEAGFDPESVKRIQLQQFNWIRTWFERDGMVVVPEVNRLPEEAAMEKSVLAANKARALIAFPMMKGGQVSGFVGYTSLRPMPNWTPGVSELLSVLSEVIASALARQRAESALRESEGRLSFLVSTSPVTIYTRSQLAPFELTWVSENIQQIMGLDRDSLTERSGVWFDRVHPDDQHELASATYEMLDGQLHQREYRVRFGDGSYHWVQDQIRLARDDISDKSELVGYWMDITERKRIEGELARFNHELEQRVAIQTQSVIESERFARATLDTLDARVAILDEQGDILATNRAWQESNLEKSAINLSDEGINYLEICDVLCGPKGSNPTAKPIANGIQAVIKGSTADFLHEYTCPQAAEPRWFVCRVKRFQGDGAVRVVVSHEDITTMKLIERQQMRSQRLESLGTLAGGVAHDLNNSLAPILMGMGILQEQYPEEDKLISMINNSAKRGADMVRQLLAFAKGVDGQRIALQPAHLVNELESLMRGSFPKNIEVEVDCDRKLPTVLGDATQLHQILLNLCVNARDAMPHGGKLTMTGKPVEIDATYARSMGDAKPGHYVNLRVSDTGEGIPPDILDKIFDPFFTTKSQDKGTGLGLSTVLGIVKGHDGFVQVNSIQGSGTTFSVFLPVAQSGAGSKETVAAAPTFRGQGETILFVDDEPTVREVGMAVLTRLNFLPLTAVDGEDGLIKVAENRSTIKAIITDMHMPHMDGLAFVHAVRRTLPNVPIILASGRVDDIVAKEFRALGVKARLDKPFTEIQLAEKLGALLAPAEAKG